MSSAKHIIRLWNWTALSSGILGVASLLLALMSISIIFPYITHNLPKQNGKLYSLIIVPIALCSLCLFAVSVHSKTNRANNVGATLNVGCYHQLKHLRRLYPKAPCHKVVKPCKQSLSKAYSTSQKKILTKHEILQKYKEFKKPYRKTRGNTGDINNSRSLHPRAPHWYEFL